MGYIGSYSALFGNFIRNVTAGSFIPTSSTVPTNGVYLPAANSVALSTNGTGRLFVDANGNVGVQRANPSAALDVESAADQDVLRLRNNGGNNTKLLFVNKAAGLGEIWYQGDFRFVDDENADTERLRITSAGLVGIGTSSVNSLLHLKTSANNDLSVIEAGTDNGNQIFKLGTGGSGAAYIQLKDGSGVVKAAFSTTGSSYFTGGSLGIGTTSPSSVLHLKTASTPKLILDNSDSSTDAVIDTWWTGTPLAFNIGTTERARIDGSGRLLVGTSSAVGAGSVGELLQIGFSGGSRAILANTSTSLASGALLGQIDFTTNVGSSISTGASIKANCDGTAAAGDAPTRLVFSTTADGASSPTERLRIDSSGRVGIGTSSPGFFFDCQGANGTNPVWGYNIANIVDNQTNDSGLRIGSSASTTGVCNLVAATNSAASQFGFYTYNGSAWGERVRIDSSGRLGIGTTIPATPLHVQSSTGTQLTLERTSTASAYSVECLRGARDSQGLFTDGTGIALRAEDATNGVTSIALLGSNVNSNNIDRIQFSVYGSERARIDSSGRLLVGTSTSVNVGSTVAATNQVTHSASAMTIAAWRQGGAGTLVLGGTSSGNTGAVSANTTYAEIRFAGGDGTDLQTIGAAIAAAADGSSWTTNDGPTRLVFSTTADGAASPTERMRISQNGVVTIKNGAVAEIDTLTDAATITPNFAAGCNFTVTLGGNRTIANPSNLTAGQSGSIFLVQDATGSRTVSWGSYWDFPGGTAPTLSTAANAVDRVDYIVRSSTSIHTVFTANYS